MASYGLYTHIRANRWRSLVLLAGLFLLVYLMVYAGALLFEGFFNNRRPLEWILHKAWRDLLQALPVATLGTAIWLVIAYFWHQKLIDMVTEGRDATRREEPRLYNLLENLCISRGIPMPKLKVSENPALNAFATGLNQRQYSITVTSGLMQTLDDAELEAVLGHELTHIRNGDVRMMVIAGVIAGIVGFFAELVFRWLFNSEWRFNSSSSKSSSDSDSKGSGGVFAIIIALALIALAWFLSVAIRFALSRSREFLADAGSVELTKNADAMISALRKIEGRGEIEGATSAVMEMCVDNPREGVADLFATHPSVQSRVTALVKNAGGHDPGPIALPGAEPQAEPPEPAGQGEEQHAPQPTPAAKDKLFLPPNSPIDLGGGMTNPWGPRGGR